MQCEADRERFADEPACAAALEAYYGRLATAPCENYDSACMAEVAERIDACVSHRRLLFTACCDDILTAVICGLGGALIFDDIFESEISSYFGAARRDGLPACPRAPLGRGAAGGGVAGNCQ